MSSKLPELEIVVIIVALGAFVGYHAWFFALRAGCTRRTRGYGVNGKGKAARLIFTLQMVETPIDASILGIQQSRNAMMAASFQTSIAAVFFNEILTVVLSPSQLRAVTRFSLIDPLLIPVEAGQEGGRVGVTPVLAILVLNLAIVLAALLTFVVVVRLYIHAGYFYRAAREPSKLVSTVDAAAITLQAQTAYTAGQRLMFFFPITIMWLVGPTAMAITSAIVTSMVALLDRWDADVDPDITKVLEADREAAQAAANA